MNPEQNPVPTPPIQQPVAEQAPTQQQNCPSCKELLPPSVYFCPLCGHKIKEPPPSTTVGKQIGIYVLSIIAPPFGLIPGIKYVLQKDPKTRMIGIVAIILTIISFTLTAWFAIEFFNTANQQLNSQLNGLQGF